VSRAIEGHQFLPRFLAFFRDRCGFTFGDVETVEDSILELAQRSYSNIGIEALSEYSQDNVNLIFTKLRREIGPSPLAAKLRRPLAAAVSFDVALEEEHFWAEQVAEVVAPFPLNGPQGGPISFKRPLLAAANRHLEVAGQDVMSDPRQLVGLLPQPLSPVIPYLFHAGSHVSRTPKSSAFTSSSSALC
jgi:hypothetical protein